MSPARATVPDSSAPGYQRVKKDGPTEVKWRGVPKVVPHATRDQGDWMLESGLAREIAAAWKKETLREFECDCATDVK